MAWFRKRRFSTDSPTNHDHMGQTRDLSLLELGLYPKEETGDSPLVQSWVPLVLEGLWEEQ